MGTILIVDPSAFGREMLASVLEAQGYHVCVCTPAQLLAKLPETKPALMILDPEAGEQGGFGLLESVRRDLRWKELPVIAVTELSNKAAVLQAASHGVRDYILKSRFTLAELLMRVRKHATPKGGVSSERTTATEKSPGGIGSAKATPTPSISPEEDREMIRHAAEAKGISILSKGQMLQRIDRAKVKTLPGAIADLIGLVSSPRGSVFDVAQALKRDPVLSMRILRVANSAAFASERARTTTVEDAVKSIGVAGVRNLVMNVGIFETFATAEAGDRTTGIIRCWQHSLAVASLMEKLTPDSDEAPAGTGYIVGLCHDLADIILRQYFFEEYAHVLSLAAETCRPQREVERVLFGLPRDEMVTILLARLGLPAVITAPIQEFFERADHPRQRGAGSVLGRTLRMANVYAHGLMLAPSPDEPVIPLSKAECISILGHHVPHLDDSEIRSGAITTAAVLAGMISSNSNKQFEPFIPSRSLRLCYVRHDEYGELDPLHALLRLSAEQVELTSRIPNHPKELEETAAMVVAPSRSAEAAQIQQDLDRLAKLSASWAGRILYLVGGRTGNLTVPQNVTMGKLPTTIAEVGAYLSESQTPLVQAA